MTDADLLRIAQECNLGFVSHSPQLRAFAARIRAETIEECASLVDDIPGIDLIEVSAAIRALGEAVR